MTARFSHCHCFHLSGEPISGVTLFLTTTPMCVCVCVVCVCVSSYPFEFMGQTDPSGPVTLMSKVLSAGHRCMPPTSLQVQLPPDWKVETKSQNLRNPSCCILSHTHINFGLGCLCLVFGLGLPRLYVMSKGVLSKSSGRESAAAQLGVSQRNSGTPLWETPSCFPSLSPLLSRIAEASAAVPGWGALKPGAAKRAAQRTQREFGVQRINGCGPK